MTPEHDRYLDWTPAYVLGTLDDSELAEFEQHLATECTECNQELLRASRDLESLAAANIPVAPSAPTEGG